MNFSRHCDLCENRISSLDNGLTCNLTNKRPDFNETCSKITLGKKLEKKLEIANLEFEMIRRNKKSVHFAFYYSITIGFLLILLGYFFSDWNINSIFIWNAKIGIIVVGFIFLSNAYSKLNKYKKEHTEAKTKRVKIDTVLDRYGISYNQSFDFKEKIHGTQEVIVTIEYNNWTKVQTINSYKFDSK